MIKAAKGKEGRERMRASEIGFRAHRESLEHPTHVIEVPQQVLGPCRPTDQRKRSE
jgi:hypothetical protein